MGCVIIQQPLGISPATTVSGITTANVSGTNYRHAREDHVHAGVYAAGVSNLGNTLGNTGTKAGPVVLVGGNNITLSQTTNANNGVTVSILMGVGGGLVGGMSTEGNTAGTTGLVNGQLVFVASNGLNASQSINGASGSLSLFNSVAFGASNTGNTAGNTRTGQQTYVMAGTRNVTASQSTGNSVDTVWLSYGGEIDRYQPAFGSVAVAAFENASCYVMPLPLMERLVVDRACMLASISLNTHNNSSHAAAFSFAYGVYTKNVSTLSQHTSGSTFYQYTNTAGDSTSVVQGGRVLTCPLSATLTPGDYWLAVWMRSTTTNLNIVTMTISVVSGPSQSLSGHFMSAYSRSVQPMFGSGRLSVSSSTLNNSIAFSDIDGGSTAWRNPPLIILVNGTV